MDTPLGGRERRRGSAQYWLKGQPSPTGDIPRNPIPEYRATRTRGRQSGYGTRGLREGYGMEHYEGWHDGYDQAEGEGRAYGIGFGHGMFNGGMQGYGDGYGDHFDGWDDYG